MIPFLKRYLSRFVISTSTFLVVCTACGQKQYFPPGTSVNFPGTTHPYQGVYLLSGTILPVSSVRCTVGKATIAVGPAYPNGKTYPICKWVKEPLSKDIVIHVKKNVNILAYHEPHTR